MRRSGIPRWLYPGMHLKRWLLLMLPGHHACWALGAAILIVGWLPAACRDDSFIFALTGAGLDRPIRGQLVALHRPGDHRPWACGA